MHFHWLILPSPLALPSVLVHTWKFATEAEEATEEKGTDPFLPSPLPSSFRLCFRLRFHGSH